MHYEVLKTKLETELADITAELEKIGTYNPNTGDWVAIPESESLDNADENIDADAAEEWAARRAILANLETRYRNLIRALQKMESETYGFCEISGDPIEPERLNANPAARTTIANRDKEADLPL